MLLHLVDATEEDPAAAWRTVRAELAGYGAGLEAKPEVLALNKVDAVPAEDLKARAAGLEAAAGVQPILCSGVSGDGVQTVLAALLEHILADRAAEAETDAEAARGGASDPGGPSGAQGPEAGWPGGWRP